MNRDDFLKVFSAAPLTFISADSLQSIETRDECCCFVIRAGGKTYGLGMDKKDFSDDPMRGFESLAHAARETFVEKIIFQPTEIV